MKIRIRYVALSIALVTSFFAGRYSVDTPSFPQAREIEAIRLSMIENNFGMPVALPVKGETK